MKRIITTFLAVIASISFIGCSEAPKTEIQPETIVEIVNPFQDVMEAAVKIILPDGSSGSGTITAYENGYYTILTCGHVLRSNTIAYVQFYKHGFRSQKYEAQVVKSVFREGTVADYGWIKLHEKQLAGYKPKIIPIAPANLILPANTHIYGAGCPKGYFLQYWEGRVISNNASIYMNMPPIEGQSGSGIITNIGNRPLVVGILAWRMEKPGQLVGGGPHISAIYNNKVSALNSGFKQIIPTSDAPCRKCGHPKSAHTMKYIDGVPVTSYLGNGMYRADPGLPPLLFCPSGNPPPSNVNPQEPNNDEWPFNNPGEVPLNPGNVNPQPIPENNTPQNPENNVENPEGEWYNNDTTKFSIAGVLGVIVTWIVTFVRKKWGRIAAWFVNRRLSKRADKIANSETAKKIEDKIESITDKIPDDVLSRIEELAKKRFEEEFKVKLDEILKKKDLSEEIVSDVDTQSKVVPTSESPVTINNNNYNMPGQSTKIPPYFIEFFDHKEKDGESKHDWALIGVLYKEAFAKLRNGELYYKDDVPLQGQGKTADVIDTWVRSEYVKRSSLQDLQIKNSVYHDAMLGFLYREAVTLLRKGHFNLLGGKETSEAIEAWVQKELLERMNIKF